MSITVRIKHKPDPAKPESPDGIIAVEVNGRNIDLPLKGMDKVISEKASPLQIYTEHNKDNQSL